MKRFLGLCLLGLPFFAFIVLMVVFLGIKVGALIVCVSIAFWASIVLGLDLYYGES